SHNSGAHTIQQGIDAVKDRGGKVCLAPGDYLLREPIRIEGANSVRVQGHGWTTRLIFLGEDAALIVQRARGVTLEEFLLVAPARRGSRATWSRGASWGASSRPAGSRTTRRSPIRAPGGNCGSPARMWRSVGIRSARSATALSSAPTTLASPTTISPPQARSG